MRKQSKENPRCWDCAFAEYYDVQWNRTPEGVPITKHCHRDPAFVKRGIMERDPACEHYK